MDKPSVHQNKGSKRGKSKKKPVKVVYISNPMKVKASVSEFRALVQELTGRDSDMADSTRKVSGTDGGVEGFQTANDEEEMKTIDDHVPDHVPQLEPHHYQEESPGRLDPFFFEPFDDVFTSQMLENFAGFSSK